MIWAHYILQVNIYLSLFYCFYKLLLAKETYFVFNRIYLVGAGILSLSIPFLRFEWFTRQEAAQKIYHGVDHLNTLVTGTHFLPVQQEQNIDWGKITVLIYFAGIMLLLLRLFFQLSVLKKILSGITSGQALSFLNKKIVDPELPQSEIISHHEDIHIKQRHTYDILFFELLSIFVWFNPFIYLYKRTIRNIHEYLADEQAASFQGNKEEYALLLLSKAFNVDPHMLTNNFYNRSLIKKRILMLHKTRSKRTAILKYGMFVPLFGLTLVLSSSTIRKNQEILEVAESLPVTEALETVILPPPPIVRSMVFKFAPPNIKKDHDWNGFYKYLASKLRYPATAIYNEKQGNSVIKFVVKNGIVLNIGIVDEVGEGCETEAMRVLLGYPSFKEMPDGNYVVPVAFRLSGSDSPVINDQITKLDDHTQLKSIYVTGIKIDKTDTDYKELENVIIRGVPSLEKQSLIVINGKVNSHIGMSQILAKNIETVNVLSAASATELYGTEAKHGAILITTKNNPVITEIHLEPKEVVTVGYQQDPVYDYTSTDEQPTYPGGIDKFRDYLAKTVKYPSTAVKAKLSGTVYVNFIVEKDGSLSDVNVARKIGSGLDDEAIRVVRGSKKWVPGIVKGKPVRVKFSIPVKFALR